MVDHLQSRVMPWRKYASNVKVRGTLSKIDVSQLHSTATQAREFFTVPTVMKSGLHVKAVNLLCHLIA